MPLTMTDDMTIQEQISLWLVHLSSDDASDADRRAFETWLADDPVRRAEYRRARRLWAGMDGAQELADLVAEPAPAVNPQPAAPEGFVRRLLDRLAGWMPEPVLGVQPVVGAAAAALVIVVIGGIVLQNAALGPGEAVHATKVAEIRDVVLPDGSLVTLGARSEIETDFSGAERRVTLASGEAFFSIEKDPARPFVVMAGETRVRVVGTKFDMRHGVEEVTITVLEGTVEVDRIGDTVFATAAPPVRNVLTAGQEIVSASRGDVVVREKPVEAVAAWRMGRLLYADEALREVIADANRYYDGEILLATDDLGDLRVTAGFRSGQIDQMIRGLTAALELEADRTSGNRVVLRRKDDPA
ncbi:MAG: FecR domain-containing protein [Sphingomonadales bacterium]|nr:FecR domain-containing protein [Sphingomonadales bacterium]